MSQESENRFDDFFQEPVYLSLKNHLYNYRVRKRVVRDCLRRPEEGLTLEVGSGISPLTQATQRTVYTELSFSALRLLKRQQGAGHYVVADATKLPFKGGSFRNVVCSEVLEHIEDDRGAVAEMAGVLNAKGRLIVTFPHRKDFFALDDRFVGHHRRYDLQEMLDLLEKPGLRKVMVGKVLGPLEKITMWSVVALLSVFSFAGPSTTAKANKRRLPAGFVKLFEILNRFYAGLAQLDARLMPTRLAMVLVAVAEKP